jgi:hypothetical protein
MTNPSLVKPRNRWLVPLIMLLIGALVGYYFGQRTREAKARLGQCIRGDSTVVANNVTEQSCEDTCATCMWEQNAR